MKKQKVDTPYAGSWADTQARKAYKLPGSDEVPVIFPGSKHAIFVETVKWEDRKWWNG